MAKKKQMCDVSASKGFPRGWSNEQLRNYASQAYNRKLTNNLDPTRVKLNFEVTKGGVIVPVDKSKSINRRITENLRGRGIKDPNRGLEKPQIRTVANFLLGGSREQMHRLAFGGQQVNLNKGADNSGIGREEGIEKWALDVYFFMAKKYGEDNIVSFIVHLDETNPHVHCTVLPVTEQNKISWKQVMVGADKYEYRRRMTQLHDEFAEVNEKYGLERGDSVAATGARHRSYNEWLEEQNKEMEKKLDIQKQTLYNINAEISKAERRVKGLSTMLSNLEAQKRDVEDRISTLESQLQQGQIDNEELLRRKTILTNELYGLNGKIKERELQLAKARQQLQDIADHKSELEKKSVTVERKLREDMTRLHAKTMREMQQTGWLIAVEDARERSSQANDYISHLPSNERKIVEDFADEIFDGSIFEEMARYANEITVVASALFLGYLDQTVSFSRSYGGGSSPGPGWGREKDDDDEAWRRKCFFMGVKMMRPANKQIRNATFKR